MTISDFPLVSILTPSFNQGAWLSENLTSVQNQTYANIEQIVMDAGSTDGTLEILRNAPSNVHWKSESDRGQSHALNKALAASTGEIIGWINSDDAYVDRRSVEAAVQAFQKNPEVGIVYGYGIIVDENNTFMLAIKSPRYNERILELGIHFLQPTVFFRRSILPEPFVREDLHFCMDLDLFLKMRASKVRFLRIPVVVGLDRQQPERKTVNNDDMLADLQNVLAERDIPFGRKERIERKVRAVWKRWSGVGLAATIASQVVPAIDIQFPPTLHRFLSQSILPMRRIYESSR